MTESLTTARDLKSTYHDAIKKKQVNIKIPTERRDNIEGFLPPHQPNNTYPDNELHNIFCKEFIYFVKRTYDDMINSRKHLFKLPVGKASHLFINEFTIWLDHYNRSIPFKSIALKVFMMLPCLLL